MLSPFEAAAHVAALEPLGLDDVGSPRWMRQSASLEQLKMQACADAMSKHDEFVVDELVGAGKVGVLVHQLLVLEAWRDHVLPVIADDLPELSSMKAYMLVGRRTRMHCPADPDVSQLYQETTVLSVLQILFYHRNAVDSVADLLLELTDYCHRRLTALNAGVARTAPDLTEIRAYENVGDRVRRQAAGIAFALASDAVSLLRFITDQVDQLPLGLVNRMVNQQGRTQTRAHGRLAGYRHGHGPVYTTPQRREGRCPCGRLDTGLYSEGASAGQVEKFTDQQWKVVERGESQTLTRLEGNLWIALCNLMTSARAQQTYEVNDTRKSTIMKLRRFFNEVVVDQLPVLEPLWRMVEQLAIVDANPMLSATPSSLLVEQVAEIRQRLLANDFQAIARKQLGTVFRPDNNLRQELGAFANLFDSMPESTEETCGSCGKPAENRCSACKRVWFCSRRCQLDAWPEHKLMCHPPGK
ncbi:hypothetical protein PBRA_007517 [Plasmodiophora brassicae]|uniref:MYND-type domain-containing protein n=1 Tax=Plasmodiophora brassicae TaxID=37360 RepID=A0A0G4IWS9_PLABS|nr:hypothetical protein PBRA_007517 [Plasmodiophora brassicae]